MKQNHLISTVTRPKLPKKTIDFLVMFVRLYVEQVAGRKPQTIDNREKDLIRRIAEFLRQIKNPYCFRCGKFTVRAQFADNGVSLEDCLKQILI